GLSRRPHARQRPRHPVEPTQRHRGRPRLDELPLDSCPAHALRRPVRTTGGRSDSRRPTGLSTGQANNQMKSVASADVVVVGCGVIGCSIAYSLAAEGVRVALIERGQLASGASGVAAGMLAPQVEAPFADAFFELTLAGRGSHAALAERLRDEVGLDVEF